MYDENNEYEPTNTDLSEIPKMVEDFISWWRCFIRAKKD